MSTNWPQIFSRLRLQWTMPSAGVVTMLELLLPEYLKRRAFGGLDNRLPKLLASALSQSHALVETEGLLRGTKQLADTASRFL